MGFFRLNLILDFVHLTLTNSQCGANIKNIPHEEVFREILFFLNRY